MQSEQQRGVGGEQCKTEGKSGQKAGRGFRVYGARTFMNGNQRDKNKCVQGDADDPVYRRPMGVADEMAAQVRDAGEVDADAELKYAEREEADVLVRGGDDDDKGEGGK